MAPSDPAAVAGAIVTLREPRCYAAARLALGSIAPFYAWDRVAARSSSSAVIPPWPPIAPARPLRRGIRARAQRMAKAVGRRARAVAHRGVASYDEYRTRQREQT